MTDIYQQQVHSLKPSEYGTHDDYNYGYSYDYDYDYDYDCDSGYDYNYNRSHNTQSKKIDEANIFTYHISDQELKDMDLVEEINFLYGISSLMEEKGHNTIGHNILSKKEKEEMEDRDADPLYGEITVKGVRTFATMFCMKLMDSKVLYDFGMGCGKLLLIILNLFPNIERLEGFELSRSRYNVAIDAFKKYYKLKLVKEDENSAEFET